MNKPMKRVIAVAIESYMHAPRVLSVSKVVRQLAAVFPDQDRETLAQQVQKSRRIIAVNARGNYPHLRSASITGMAAAAPFEQRGRSEAGR
jgi:hypothetical protein